MRFILLSIVLLLGFSVLANAETIKIAGSGQMLPLAVELGKGYSKKYPADTVEVNPKSLGQRNGVQAVNDGFIDIATSARRLDDDEKRLQVKAYEIASVAGFFAVNASVPVKGLTSQQICDIYSGKIKNWKEVGGPNAAIVALTRPEKDSTKIVMRRHLPGFAKVKEPAEVASKLRSKDMVEALSTTPNAIGMIDAINYANAAGKMVALKLDGKDITSSATGPIQHYYNFVLGKNPAAADLRFLEFVRSPEGQKIIKQEMAHPLKFNL
jgi:phosphate transport system substrate-binding protein